VAQTLDQQNEVLTAANVIKTFSDTMSGARDDRPGLAEFMAYAREGDTVVVWNSTDSVEIPRTSLRR
jgi:DNA invertase Pin-like site-specific DNA recombinase